MTSYEDLISRAEQKLSSSFSEIDAVAMKNQRRVLDAFRHHRISEEYFNERTGYGIDDAGRDMLDKVFATICGAESAAMRVQMVSGTHALACAIFGNLTPGSRMTCVTGRPYDTMEKVIGLHGEEPGSLKKLGVEYMEVDVCNFADDPAKLKEILEPALVPPTALAYIQRSCGYSFSRKTLTINEIGNICRAIKQIRPDCPVMVDNCYGEFVEEQEPLLVGADIIAGSLIKNPGGGLAISGGYFAGRKHLVESALNRLTAPGIGGHIGINFNQNRLLFQGLFLAPAVVANAVKGAMLFAQVFSDLGFEVNPQPQTKRSDIIQCIKFGDPAKLTGFLKALQYFSPVNAHVTPEPADMPGYQDKVVMAGGTFIEGSTIELSADGPLREPYAAFVQGGLSYLHVKCALAGVLELGNTDRFRFFKA